MNSPTLLKLKKEIQALNDDTTHHFDYNGTKDLSDNIITSATSQIKASSECSSSPNDEDIKYSPPEFMKIEQLKCMREAFSNLKIKKHKFEEKVKIKSDILIGTQEKLKEKVNLLKQETVKQSEQQNVIQSFIEEKKKAIILKKKINIFKEKIQALLEKRESNVKEYESIEDKLRFSDIIKRNELINQRDYLQIELSESEQIAKDLKLKTTKYEMSQEDMLKLENLKKKQKDIKLEIETLSKELKDKSEKFKQEKNDIVREYNGEINSRITKNNQLKQELKIYEEENSNEQNMWNYINRVDLKEGSLNKIEKHCKQNIVQNFNNKSNENHDISMNANQMSKESLEPILFQKEQCLNENIIKKQLSMVKKIEINTIQTNYLNKSLNFRFDEENASKGDINNDTTRESSNTSLKNIEASNSKCEIASKTYDNINVIEDYRKQQTDNFVSHTQKNKHFEIAYGNNNNIINRHNHMNQTKDFNDNFDRYQDGSIEFNRNRLHALSQTQDQENGNFPKFFESDEEHNICHASQKVNDIMMEKQSNYEIYKNIEESKSNMNTNEKQTFKIPNIDEFNIYQREQNHLRSYQNVEHNDKITPNMNERRNELKPKLFPINSNDKGGQNEFSLRTSSKIINNGVRSISPIKSNGHVERLDVFRHYAEQPNCLKTMAASINCISYQNKMGLKCTNGIYNENINFGEQDERRPRTLFINNDIERPNQSKTAEPLKTIVERPDRSQSVRVSTTNRGVIERGPVTPSRSQIVQDIQSRSVTPSRGPILQNNKSRSVTPSRGQIIQDNRSRSAIPSRGQILQDNRTRSATPSRGQLEQDNQARSVTPSRCQLLHDNLSRSPTPARGQILQDNRTRSVTPSRGQLLHDNRTRSVTPSRGQILQDNQTRSVTPSRGQILHDSQDIMEQNNRSRSVTPSRNLITQNNLRTMTFSGHNITEQNNQLQQRTLFSNNNQLTHQNELIPRKLYNENNHANNHRNVSNLINNRNNIESMENYVNRNNSTNGIIIKITRPINVNRTSQNKNIQTKFDQHNITEDSTKNVDDLTHKTHGKQIEYNDQINNNTNCNLETVFRNNNDDIKNNQDAENNHETGNYIHKNAIHKNSNEINKDLNLSKNNKHANTLYDNTNVQSHSFTTNNKPANDDISEVNSNTNININKGDSNGDIKYQSLDINDKLNAFMANEVKNFVNNLNKPKEIILKRKQINKRVTFEKNLHNNTIKDTAQQNDNTIRIKKRKLFNATEDDC